MADIKKKGSMDKPKVKTSGFVPKEAKSIIKEKYQEQQERNAPGQKDPVRYATDHVDGGGKRVARTAGNALKQKVKKEFVRRRRKKVTQDTNTVSEQPQTSSSQPPNTPGEVLETNTDTPLDLNHFDSYGRAESPTKYYRHDLSTTSTKFSATNSARLNDDTQNIGGRQKELGRKKAIKDAQRSNAKKAEQNKFSTRDQSHLAEPNRHEPPGGGKRPLPNAGNKNAGSFDKPRRNGVQSPVGQRETPDFRIPAGKDRNLKTLGQKPSSKVPRSLKVDGNRPKLGTALQKRKTPFQRSKTVQRQLSPAQQAKALARRRAQKEIVKKAGQRTKQAAAKAGKLTMRFAQAVGRVALAAVKGVLAAGGGVILLIVLLCLILVAAIAASPFGIFFAGGGSQDGVPVSVAVAQVNYAYNETLEELQTAESYDDVVIEGTGADWVDVLAVFAVKVAGSNDTDATDVVTLDENRIDRLEAVFWDMNTIIHEVDEIDHPESSEGADDGYTERILHITITGKTAEEAAAEYNFTTQQLEMLQELLEEREMLADLIGSLMNITADAKDVLLNLPEDLSPEREAVIRAACSLVGKVNYFWGGKSLVLGWDSRWGRLTEVTAAGNSTTGTYRPYGLDCSGFVDWVFYNATGGEYIIGHGGGAMAQHGYCTSISWAEAQIGDLVFYPEDTHVGIVCGWDESGNILIVHCAFSANNVVITGQEGFTTIGRPVFYGGA